MFCDCADLLGLTARLLIFFFYQLQFLKSVLFLCTDAALQQGVIANMARIHRSGTL